MKKGFTLIELLVVIAVIGLLATLSVIALSNARVKSRDAKRVADVRQIQKALELYYNDAQTYPATLSVGASIAYNDNSGFVPTTTYMVIVPDTSNPPDGPCNSGQNQFSYSRSADGSSYTLAYCLGGSTGSLSSGVHCATPGGIDTGTGCAGSGTSTPPAWPPKEQLYAGVIKGNYLYAVDGGNLKVFSLSDPSAPVKVAQISSGVSYGMLDLDVVGNYAYGIAPGNSDYLVIFDITNPSAPIKITDFTDAALAHNPFRISVSNGYAYLGGAFSGGLQVVNVIDPYNPVLAPTNISTSSNEMVTSLKAVGGYLYRTVSNNNGAGHFDVFDISSPTNPVLAASVLNGDNGAALNGPYGFSLAGNYAYVASAVSNALEVIDITNPATAVHYRTVNNGDGGAALTMARGVFVSGNYVYVASMGDKALEVLSLPTPGGPVHLRTVSLINGDPQFFAPQSVLGITGSYVQLANMSNNFSTYLYTAAW
jgi:prepilin-type N-terminal cleavage/methylation domain-containing protein